MTIKYYCPRWGSAALPYRVFFRKVKEAGYDGVEMSFPTDPNEKMEILEGLEVEGLELVAQHWETMTPDFEAHRKQYLMQLMNLTDTGALLINTQTGKDHFSFGQNLELIGIAGEVSEKTGMKIVHETHRGKFSFAAHVTHRFMNHIPDLRLGLDLSHWVNVAESWLQDQPSAVELALSRTDHIHARVGFPEGPQIPDPRDPQWSEALDRHVGWWRQVAERRRNEGAGTLTITPEFGPEPYMTILPGSAEPITDQWEVNRFMMEHLKAVL